MEFLDENIVRQFYYELESLCGDRVVQMTKTYNDIDAVTRLLEEKEKDLELAAKIGQSLLQQNKQLDIRIETLEEQVTVLSDQNTQLRHDIKLKDELLQIYTNDVSYSDSEDDSSWSEKSKPMSSQTKFIDVDTLQKKVRNLEEENLYLRIETADMRTTTTSIEEKEQQLVHDCVKQLGEAQGRESIITEELSKKYEESARQQEEITSLLANLVDMQTKVKKLTIENEEMQQHLQAARESQQELTEEVQDLRDKYDECHEMLLESQEAVKEVHRRSLPQGKVPSYSSLNPLPVFPLDSLAAELVNTVEQELGVEQHLTGKGKRDHQRRVMRTVKAANKRTFSRQSSISDDLSTVDFFSRRTSPSSSLISLAGSPRSEQYEGDNESTNSPIGKSKQLGKPGIPGSNDLETALRRISLRRQNNEAERKYKEEEKERLLTKSDIEDSGEQTPTCITPGSLWSSDGFAYSGAAAHNFKAFMPEKLQIVKPMEGSMTLYHWQRLATPHMASMLDNRPGVVVKGFREIDKEEDVFALDDLEDDGMFRSTVPSKCFVNTSSTYTYTTSNIGLLDNTNLTSSTMGPKMTSLPQMSTSANTRARATSTFSTSIGLAQVLQERTTPTTPSVLLKAEASCAPSPRKANSGLNFFSASRAAEKKAEMSTMPGGVHQVRRGIISRNATPVLSKTAARVLDPETKERLMEKVKAIRAEKETIRRLSISETTGLHTTRTSSLTMCSAVSRAPPISPPTSLPAFKTGLAPGFSSTPGPSYASGMTMSTSALSGMTMSTSAMSGMMMSSSTLSGMTMSTTTLSSNRGQPSIGFSPSTGAIPKASSVYMSSSTGARPGASGAMCAMSSSLILSSSSMSSRTSVLPPGAIPTPPKFLPLTSDTGVGLGAIGSLGPQTATGGTGAGFAAMGSLGPQTATGGTGAGLAAMGSLGPQAATGGTGAGLAAMGSLGPQAATGGSGVGLAAIGSLGPQAATASAGVALAAAGSLDPPAGPGVGLAAIGSLSPQGATGISRGVAGPLSPQGSAGGVGLGAAGAMSPHSATSPISILSGNLSVLKTRHPSGRRL